MGLRERLSELGRSIGEREARHRDELDAARRHAEELHRLVAEALEDFHASCLAAGAPHLEIELSAPRPDEKHIRSIQFDLRRGRHRAIVTSKTRGEVTLVGPFRAGKQEGPCKTFPSERSAELEAGLEVLLEALLDEAFRP